MLPVAEVPGKDVQFTQDMSSVHWACSPTNDMRPTTITRNPARRLKAKVCTLNLIMVLKIDCHHAIVEAKSMEMYQSLVQSLMKDHIRVINELNGNLLGKVFCSNLVYILITPLS